MKIIRFRKVKELAQSYTANNSQRHELNTTLTLNSELLNLGNIAKSFLQSRIINGDKT